MSVFHGPQQAGALREHRKAKRREAIERNAATPPERRSAKRQDAPPRKRKPRRHR